MLHHLGAQFAAGGGDVVHNNAAALKTLWSLTWREAQVQTYADAFLVVGFALAAASLLTPLMKKVAAPAAPSSDAH
jgi:DHA2 family multidrug resistance protein